MRPLKALKIFMQPVLIRSSNSLEGISKASEVCIKICGSHIYDIPLHDPVKGL